MGFMTVHPQMEVQQLVASGLLNKGICYQVQAESAMFLSIYNRVDGRRLLAEFAYDAMRPVAQAYQLCITEEVAEQDPEIVSVYSHSDLEHLVRTAKGFLYCYSTSTPQKLTKKGAVTVRVDDDLRELFEKAVDATGESQAVVLRQLMRFFVGKGPDPRMLR